MLALRELFLYQGTFATSLFPCDFAFQIQVDDLRLTMSLLTIELKRPHLIQFLYKELDNMTRTSIS